MSTLTFDINLTSVDIIPPMKRCDISQFTEYICTLPYSISLLPNKTTKIDLGFQMNFPDDCYITMSNYEFNLDKFQVLTVPIFNHFNGNLYCYIRSLSPRRETLLAGSIICVMIFNSNYKVSPKLNIINPENSLYGIRRQDSSNCKIKSNKQDTDWDMDKNICYSSSEDEDGFKMEYYNQIH